jgi:hypothetical protein
VEILVAMIVGAIVLTTLLRGVSAQGQLSDLQSAKEEVQQNSRASLELIASELRAVAGDGSIVRAARDSITFRTTRLWGVICELSLEHLEMRVGELDARYFSVTAGSGLVVNVGTVDEPVWTDAVRVLSSRVREGRCGGETADEAEVVTLLSLTLSGTPRLGTAVGKPGNLAGVFDQVTYRSGPSSGLPGRWIQRRSGDGSGSTNQPLAGPIRPRGEGLRFRYYDTDGTVMSVAPGGSSGRDSIVAVEILVDATSLDDRGGIRAARRDSVTIRLRNRR